MSFQEAWERLNQGSRTPEKQKEGSQGISDRFFNGDGINSQAGRNLTPQGRQAIESFLYGTTSETQKSDEEKSSFEQAVSAFLTVNVVRALNTPINVPEIGLKNESIGDRAQEVVLGSVKKFLENIGETTNLALATPENISREVQEIARYYESIRPVGGINITKLNEERENKARMLVRRLRAEEPNLEEHPPTQEEIMIAREIIKNAGIRPARELRQLLNNHVFARALDIADAELDNTLTNVAIDTERAAESLERVPPRVWFITDWTTSTIMMSPRERDQRLQDTIWAITPTRIEVRRIGEEEDIVRIALRNLTTTADIRRGDTQMYEGNLDVVDELASAATRFFRRTIDRFIEDGGVGGVLIFRNLEQDRERARIPTRNPTHTKEQLQQLASMARSLHYAVDLMSERHQEPEAPIRPFIRPKVIEELIARDENSLVLKHNVQVTPQGDIDWRPAQRKLTGQKAKTLDQLRRALIRAMFDVDKEGHPNRPEDKIPLLEAKSELERIEGELEQVSGLLSPPKKDNES